MRLERRYRKKHITRIRKPQPFFPPSIDTDNMHRYVHVYEALNHLKHTEVKFYAPNP